MRHDRLTPDTVRTGARAVYRVRVSLATPTTAIGVLLAVVFAYLIVAPVVSMLADGWVVHYGDEPRAGAPTGSLTTYYAERAMTSRVAVSLYWRPLLNTVSVAFGATLIALSLGGTLAWLLARTDLPARRWFSSALIVPYILPGWTFALAWLTLFKNRSVGGAPGWFESLGFAPPDWLAYGQVPVTIILGLHYAPFVILLVGNALRNLDTQLEDSARILGADRMTVARRIVVPLMRPAILSATILVFAECIGDFGVPYVLGLPANFDVLATTLYRSVATRQTGLAGIVAGTILLLGVLSLMIDLLLLREARRFVTMGDKGAIDRVTPLDRGRWPAAAYAGVLFGIAVVVPLTVLVMSTVMRAPGNFAASNFTFDFWIGSGLATVGLQQGILMTPALWSAAWNSVTIVGAAAVVAGLLGLMTGYVVVRVPFRPLATFLRQVTFLPYLVPGIAFAFAYLSLFAVARGPIPALYGTTLLLMLALVADQMPYASRAGIAAMMQLGRAPEEAAQVVGAGWWRRLRTIVVPIQKRALFTGMILPFISGIKNLTLFALLAVPGMDVLTTYALRLIDYQYTQAANAVVLIIAAIAYVGTALGQRVLRVSLAEGFGR